MFDTTTDTTSAGQSPLPTSTHLDSPDAENAYLSANAEFSRFTDFKSVFEYMDSILSSRGNDYAHPLDNFARIRKGWNWKLEGRFIPGKELTDEDIADLFEITKLARQTNKLKLDNPVDIMGYAACQILLVAERIRRIVAKNGDV